MQTSSTLCEHTSAFSTRTTPVWCLRCWSRICTTSSSRTSSVRCHSSTSDPSCSRSSLLFSSSRLVQLCESIRVLPAQEPHLSGVRDVGAESVRLHQAEQVQPAATQASCSRTSLLFSSSKLELEIDYCRQQK